MRTPSRIAAVVSVAALTTTLTSCGLGSSEYCDTLTENSDRAATLYTAYAAMEPPAEWAQQRLDLMDEAGQPDDEDLVDDRETYRDYLEDMTDLGPDEQKDAILLGADEPGVEDARDALADHYTGECMDG